MTFLPLRLVTRHISLLDLMVLDWNGGPMPLRWWYFCFFWKKGSMRACDVVDFMWSTKPRILVCEVFSVSFVWMEVASAEARCVGSAAVVWDPTWKLGNKSSAALCRCCVSVRACSVWASVSERSGRCEDFLCLSRSTLGSLPSFWLQCLPSLAQMQV